MPDEQLAVAKGAKFLDKILPGWYKRVDLETLDMSDGALCMLGQTFGVHAEACLAKEMYPNEYNAGLTAARRVWPQVPVSRLQTWGYRLGRDWIIPSIMRNREEDPETSDEFSVLKYVCSGHDNKCYWAEEVAERLAKDGEKEEN